ncbi:NAD(P)H dehydrogenase [marine bacterium AO1-C]|nr:NAD(P)H dehydrogenase [marine bacterium AO1-C]
MKASVILAHPYEKSFNHAIFNTVIESLQANNIQVYAHDLYEENFDPVLTKKELGTDKSEDEKVNQYASELVDSDLLIFIHPNWWGQPPAILKGYVDRVVRPPYAYDFPEGDSGGGLPLKVLKAKIGVVFNTSNTEATRENDYFGDPLENIWAKCVFGFLGIEQTHRRMFRIIADSLPEERAKWLELVKQDIDNIAQ